MEQHAVACSCGVDVASTFEPPADMQMTCPALVAQYSSPSPAGLRQNAATCCPSRTGPLLLMLWLLTTLRATRFFMGMLQPSSQIVPTPYRACFMRADDLHECRECSHVPMHSHAAVEANGVHIQTCTPTTHCQPPGGPGHDHRLSSPDKRC
jgi:hypothetical protein